MTTTWVEGAAGSLFDVDNLPYGVFHRRDEEPRVGARIGDWIVDLAPLAASAWGGPARLFESSTLNPLLAAGPQAWAEVRSWLQDLLLDPAAEEPVTRLLVPLDSSSEPVVMRLPFDVADYVDFYTSLDHATNVGKMLRPGSEPLMPNWRHLPVGYHGRAGTVVVSGTAIRRPLGQRKAPEQSEPVIGPTGRLDIEAELGFVVGVPSTLGDRVPTAAFAEHVFGVVGLNDWSARDIQGWEYVPLGPFLGKSFATSISAWVTPLAALDNARVSLPGQDPRPLDYLRVQEPAGFDIDVEVELNGQVVACPTYSSMYWSPAQMLAHLTVNGASLRTGDLFGSGTISGPTKAQRGSFLELSWAGREPFEVNGRQQSFLQDDDEVVLRYTAPGERGRISLGEVRGCVVPST